LTASCCGFVAALWQGIPVPEATPKSTSIHRNKTTMVRRAYAILLAETGRCRLSVVSFPQAVFSRVSTGRRASEEGDLSPLGKSMAEFRIRH
jgi:hypothetical protein